MNAAKVKTAKAPTKALNDGFEEKLGQLKEAQKRATAIARVVGDGELKLEEASTKLAIQLIMEMLVLMKQLDNKQSLKVVRVLDVLAKLQTSNVLRERLKADFRRAVEKARDKMVAGVRRAVKNDPKLCKDLVNMIESRAKELAR
jgi:hypothetical protein